MRCACPCHTNPDNRYEGHAVDVKYQTAAPSREVPANVKVMMVSLPGAGIPIPYCWHCALLLIASWAARAGGGLAPVQANMEAAERERHSARMRAHLEERRHVDPPADPDVLVAVLRMMGYANETGRDG